eukprot:scaffold17.g437.t1
MASGSDDDDEPSGLECLLGFVEPPERPADLLRHRFPSKLGGRPAWLDPLHLPTAAQLACRVTGQRMDFLLQVYAPLEDQPHAFHRTLFLFLSPDGGRLASAGAVRALRCQLPRHNAFYPPAPPGRRDLLPPELPAPAREAALRRDPWRVAEAERDPACWPPAASSSSKAAGGGGAAAHAAAAAAPQQQQGAMGSGSGQRRPRLYPEAELVVEPEEEEEESGGEDEGAGRDAGVAALLRQYQARSAQEGEYTEKELPAQLVDDLEGAVTPEQRHFAAFAARVAAAPSQVLRYCYQPGATPLWPAPAPLPGNIPPCERCGASRRFEFQVMPQLLNHLGVDAAHPASPDWGTLAVYTCSASCSASGDAGGGGGGRAGGASEVAWLADGMAGLTLGSDDDSAYIEDFVFVQPLV